MQKLLIKESPLFILLTFVIKIGFQEAVILQQTYFWLPSQLHIIEGRKWGCRTYEDWDKQFPFRLEVTLSG